MSKSSWEYIASGISYARISPLLETKDVYITNELARYFDILNSATNTHKVGVLYNGYTEASFGECLQSIKSNLSNIMVDSGGLQVVTLGKEITPELKEEIYTNQAMYGSTGMSFDEIPVKTVGGSSTRTETKNRFFDSDNFENFAKGSGVNLCNQLKKYVELGSNTKPVFIVHGNSLDTYNKWIELCLKEVPKELQSQIDGIAVSGSSSGMGLFEDIKRAYYVSQFEMKFNRVHLLGFGSYLRLIPTMIFDKVLYKDKFVISYDSTSHTSNCIYGRLLEDNGNVFNFGNKYDMIKYQKLMNIFKNSEFGFYDDVDLDELFFIMTNSSTKYLEKYNSTKIKYLSVITLLFFVSILNFIKNVDKGLGSKKFLLKQIRSKSQLNLISSLYDVNDKKSFEYWQKHFSGYIKSNEILSLNDKGCDLSEFF